MLYRCFWCKKEFERNPNQTSKNSKRPYCTRACYNLKKRSPLHKQDMIDAGCLSVWNNKNRVNKAIKANLKWRNENQETVKKNASLGGKAHGKGKSHPLYKNGHGRHFPYPVEFSAQLKRSIFERDNFKCAECGTNRDITVHHIDWNIHNNMPSNLITLCRADNSKANHLEREYAIRRYAEIRMGNVLHH